MRISDWSSDVCSSDLLDEIRRRDIPVLLTGMVAAPNLGADYARAFNAIYPELAAKYGASLYPFILDNVVTDPALMLDDHIHPNAKGVTMIADSLAPLVEAALPDGESCRVQGSNFSAIGKAPCRE